MPRKPKSMPRTELPHARVRAARSAPARAMRSAAAQRAPARAFHQCLACGAPTDPMFGAGAGSWCPHCHEPDLIMSAQGRLPDPQLYGQWFVQQQETTEAQTMQSIAPVRTALPSSSLSRSNPSIGDMNMKQRKSHTGTYSCPECCVEYDLTDEPVLKCDQCGGALYKGTVEEVLGAEVDPEQE
jgi:hypothetical protein